nr:hypothetical protein [Novosphingobium sp. PhB55]
MELYLKVRLACAEGLSQRSAAKRFNVSRDTVRKTLSFSSPPGYRRQVALLRANQRVRGRKNANTLPRWWSISAFNARSVSAFFSESSKPPCSKAALAAPPAKS